MRTATKLRGLALFGLLAAAPAFMTPSQACAWGIIETETFYSDASLTTRVGRCIENSCTGTFSCTGTITDFSTTTIRGC